MKKVLHTAVACFSLAAFSSYAQTTQRMPCGSDEIKAHLINTLPGYQQQVQAVEQQNAAEFQAYLSNLQAQRSSSTQALVTYTIPVVFHVLHTNGVENRSDANCIAALDNVNKDYARAKADTLQIDPLYEPLYVNSRIKFVLAKKDPYGNCTTGILHHYNENTQWNQSNIYNYIYSTVGTYNWSPSRYLNVYVVDNIIGDIQAGVSIGGYTYRPGTAPNVGSDAIVLSDELLLDPTSKGLSHEIGHWLGLAHTFDGNGGFRTTPTYSTALGIGVRCGNDDIYDTPKTPGFLSICDPYIGLSDSCDPGKRPNIHNIMDYARCPIMFTQGQTDKMRFTLANSTANRNYLVSNKNLAVVGHLIETYTLTPNSNPNLPPDTTFMYSVAPTTVCAPIADFYASKAKSCQGQTVLYNSTSYNNITGLSYSWQFEGGSPATSTLTAPSVTYAVPGNYSTTLTITNAAGTSTKVRNPFINVQWHVDQTSFPAQQGFESTNSLLPSGWTINNKNYGTITWQYGNYGSNSSQCLMIPNANGSGMIGAGDIDVLETEQYNLSNTSAISISYDYSYARKPGATGDDFKVEYSEDCGGNWKTLAGTPSVQNMATATGGTLTAPYVPFTQSKWKTVTYSGALLNNKPDVKFRFTFQNTELANAQNFYFDNFNISGTVGLAELENTIGLSIYPNPTSSSSTLEFVSPVDAKVNVSVFDVTGRLVEVSDFNATAGNTTTHNVNKNSNLKPGMYLVNLSLNGQKLTKKLIIE